MKYWEMFWTLNLVIAGTAFAFITVVVTIKGVNDLRQWFGNLRRQNQEEESTRGKVQFGSRDQ